MDYRVFNDLIVVRLDKGDEITESLLSVAKKENVTLADITGIGATDDFTVGVFDIKKGDYNRLRYEGNHEINSLVGNVTTKDGAPYLHLHITCTGGDGSVVGGHLFSARISLTAEIFIHRAEATLNRAFDPALAINRIEF